MNMFKPTEASTPQQYIDMIDEPRRADVQDLFDLISKAIPTEKVKLWNSIIGWGSYHYKTTSSEGDFFRVGLASQKNYISVYLPCTDKSGEYIAEANRAKFPKASIGKSCIRFKKLADIDTRVLVELVKYASKNVEQNYG